METPSLPPSSGAPKAEGAAPASTNWTEIERVYRTTNQSLREIAEAHGLTHSAIGKRARSNGWTRPDKPGSTPKEIAKLDPRQQRFVREYLIDPNGTQAAIRAGYSAHTATVQASDLLGDLTSRMRYR